MIPHVENGQESEHVRDKQVGQEKEEKDWRGRARL